MQIPFFKYQGTGNDFVIIDQRDRQYLQRTDQEIIERLCDRRFGIGADGLMLLQQKEGYDFEMVYFNSDGRESSMCGNGGRCITAFAHRLGVFSDTCRFWAIDGAHDAVVREDGWVELKMIDVQDIEQGSDFYYLNTGSPHYVTFRDDLADLDVFQAGRAIRYSDRFRAEGTNVNFVQTQENGITVATYERGVEDETLSCGTGVTAAAIAYHLQYGKGVDKVPIKVKGGELEVRFQAGTDGFSEIWLCGPAELVFTGEIDRL
ncbi:diaminopimelate epimerase [Flavilitoribacter nigricans]|uniref:Diaminopimelate epimerase n=1 Tax=Flavilitoribacter nigricans (strain ATCC 23147 / DSM 23189 / NBRC 102662 / NCIMB 1420 / SS-2) TaxID=1122177 RepID=A0A2D0N5H1_FLAN2|nr:diaminopimelate epimerase [Flavilitoribacter nigricans]PHN03782.1 diaminopimelate epimerase [Flavilitoribacter nigricans DSM 23189 = NBRC 102662]